MTITKPYPRVYRDIDRQGRLRWRYRPRRGKAVTIKGVYGSPEFAANYRAASEGESAEIARAGVIGKHGTFDALARSYLRSASFSQLADTRKARRLWVEQFLAQYGSLPVAALERRHVVKIMQSHAPTPGKARNVLSMLRVLIALAIDEGIREDDPTVGIKRPKLSKEGWHSWTQDEIIQYEGEHPIGSMARLAFALALYTSQRAADLIRMGCARDTFASGLEIDHQGHAFQSLDLYRD
jgi:hypothetical protein